MSVSFCLQKNRENGRKTKVGSKKPKFRKTLEEALLLYFQKKISIFLYVDWALRKNATENEEGKNSGTVGKFENEYQRKKLISDGSVKFADFEKNVQSITCVRGSVTSKQQSTSSSAHRHRLRQKWTKREAPMPFQPVRQQRKRII
ncbi:Protein CBG21579 [Caenorhabditis briggsae]|uniref:Protein CBG21579 n=1 Tax=Caenorhabditis briggsae TaxID=6238 RepID=A8Y0F2_CAEBR|nr:Protein CBG21579 [Caenorhabditis briggsae]CAP38337.1 Protein CBG21579 [Caenorhabditis briggsae]